MSKYDPYVDQCLSAFSDPHTVRIELRIPPNFDLRRFAKRLSRYDLRVVLDGARLIVEHKKRISQG